MGVLSAPYRHSPELLLHSEHDLAIWGMQVLPHTCGRDQLTSHTHMWERSADMQVLPHTCGEITHTLHTARLGHTWQSHPASESKVQENFPKAIYFIAVVFTTIRGRTKCANAVESPGRMILPFKWWVFWDGGQRGIQLVHTKLVLDKELPLG